MAHAESQALIIFFQVFINFAKLQTDMDDEDGDRTGVLTLNGSGDPGSALHGTPSFLACVIS